MKKIFLCYLAISILLTLIGCKDTNSVKPQTFDPENVQLSAAMPSGNVQVLEKTTRHYSDVMEKLGKNGLIVAGYATGLRETYYDGHICHTDTTFVVTDTYYGKVSGETIKVREPYALVFEQGKQYYLNLFGTNEEKLINDLQVLIFLYVDRDGAYRMASEFFPLMPDYNQYNDTFLESLCDFYRGDRSVYYSETGYWYITKQIEEIGLNGLPISYPMKFEYGISPWPEREISNEALLKELNDNLLVRTATEYKIAIWPHGHKNFELFEFYTNDMWRCSSYSPEEENMVFLPEETE